MAGRRYYVVCDGLSIAIPYHGNRQKFTLQTISHLIKRPDVKEVVVVLEPDSEFRYIHKKIKIIQNEKRLYVFRNKVKAVENCSYPWVALIDSDNIMNGIYLNALKSHEPLNNRIIYCPEMGLPNLIYTNFIDNDIDKESAPDCIGTHRFDMLFNTMNYVLHRDTWLNALKEALADPYEPMSCDSKYINYHCLNDGMVMRVIKGMIYRHTVDDTSFYKNNAAFDRAESPKIFEKMRKWSTDREPQKELKSSNWSAT